MMFVAKCDELTEIEKKQILEWPQNVTQDQELNFDIPPTIMDVEEGCPVKPWKRINLLDIKEYTKNNHMMIIFF